MITLTQVYQGNNEVNADTSPLPGMSQPPALKAATSHIPQMDMPVKAAVPQPQLRYSILTNPNPIRVSPPDGEPRKISVTLVITNTAEDAPAKCESIFFMLAVGATSTALTPDAAGITAAASPGWQIKATALGDFMATPTGDGIISEAKGVIFTFSNITASRLVGVSPFQISMKLKNEEPVRTTLALNKFPSDFFLDNFRSDSPLVDNGTPAVLRWEGSPEATYTIKWGDKPEQQRDVTNLREWSSHPLTEATSFILIASFQLDGQTVKQYLGLTVTVRNPTILAGNIESAGGIKLGILDDKRRTQLNVNRGLIGFSHAIADWNHTIYNNGFNLDGTTAWDGLKMNVFAGLDVKVGDVNTKPASALRINEQGEAALKKTTVNGGLEVTGTAADAKVKFGGPGGDVHHITSQRDLILNSAQGIFSIRQLTDYQNLASYTDLLKINPSETVVCRTLKIHNDQPQGTVRQTLEVTDTVNSTFRVAHPGGYRVAIGGNKDHQLELGGFENDGSSFETRLRIDTNGDVFLKDGGRLFCKLPGWKDWWHLGSPNIVDTNTIWVKSDLQLKTNIRNMESCLEKITRLHGVEYDWNETGKELLTEHLKDQLPAGPDASEEEQSEAIERRRREIIREKGENRKGFIAQEVEEVFPEWVKTDNGFKMINLSELNAVLVEAIKELKTQKDQEIAGLKTEIACLKAKIAN